MNAPKSWDDVNQTSHLTWPDQIARIRAEYEARIAALEAENARLREAERTAWEPPPEAERPYNYQCLGWVYDYWHVIFWADGDWMNDRSRVVRPTAFAALPPSPDAIHD